MWRALGGVVAMVVLYFTVPVHNDSDLAWRIVFSLIAIVAAGITILHEARSLVRRRDSAMRGLGLAVVAGVLVFALVDYIVAVHVPGEFVDMSTRIDALYFALTTLATVGYGDVHAEGQLARALVSLQLVFNLVVIATGTTVLANAIRARRSAREKQV